MNEIPFDFCLKIHIQLKSGSMHATGQILYTHTRTQEWDITYFVFRLVTYNFVTLSPSDAKQGLPW